MKKDYSKYIWGAMLILLGVFIVLRSFGVITNSIFFTGWWSLFIIIPALYGLIFNNNRITDAMVLLFGVSLFVAANDYITYSNVFAIGICLLLIDVALNIMFKRKFKRVKNSVSDGNYIGVFSGCKEKPAFFSGGTAVAVFGSVDIDLREVEFTQDAYLTGIAVFGGVDILVCDNVNVVCSTANIFGGTENKQEPIAGNHTLYIDGCSIFGGIDIKRKP